MQQQQQLNVLLDLGDLGDISASTFEYYMQFLRSILRSVINRGDTLRIVLGPNTQNPFPEGGEFDVGYVTGDEIIHLYLLNLKNFNLSSYDRATTYLKAVKADRTRKIPIIVDSVDIPWFSQKTGICKSVWDHTFKNPHIGWLTCRATQRLASIEQYLALEQIRPQE
jgi:hypothetical protein